MSQLVNIKPEPIPTKEALQEELVLNFLFDIIWNIATTQVEEENKKS